MKKLRMHDDYITIKTKIRILQSLHNLHLIKLLNVDVRKCKHTYLCQISYKDIDGLFKAIPARFN